MRNFIFLFRWINWRHMRREKVKGLLNVFGVAVGVAVFVSIRISNYSAIASFNATVDAVSGKANLQIVSRDGLPFDEQIFRTVSKLKSVAAATPVIESTVLYQTDGGLSESLLVLGVDVFTDGRMRTYQATPDETTEEDDALKFLLKPQSLIITRLFAERHGIAKAAPLPLYFNGVKKEFHVVNFLEVEGPAKALGGNFGVLDIAAAQEMLGKVGKLDRIDILVEDKDRLDEVRAYLNERLPSHLIAQAPKTRGEQVRKMLSSFQLNLTALTFIGIFVAMFLIYNTISNNALRRRKELSILRTIGTQRRDVFWMFLTEASMIGLAGSLLGLGLGILLAKIILQSITSSITALYILNVVNQLTVDGETLWFGLALGVFSSVAAALLPAYEATMSQPRESFHLQTLERKFHRRYKNYIYAGIAAFAIMLALVSKKPDYSAGFSYTGFLAAFFAIAGFTFFTPFLILLFHRGLGSWMKTLLGVEGQLAHQYLLAALRRTSIAIAALMIAVAMLISVNIMIDSFRKTVVLWIDQTVNADLFLTVSGQFSTAAMTEMPAEIIAYCRRHPDVKAVDTFRGLRIDYKDQIVDMAALDLEVIDQLSRITFVKQNSKAILPKLYQPENFSNRPVAVSENFALKHDLQEGSTLELPTPAGVLNFRIEGIYYDYTTDNGTIFLDRKLYDQIWRDSTVNNIALFLNDKTGLEKVKREIEQRFSRKYNLLIYSNYNLREEVIRIFDQTFSVTYTLEIIAMIVAGLGVANALSASIIEREREIGILKSVGASNIQIKKMILAEAGMMGLISEGIGILAGVALSMILIYVINRESFGWTIQFIIPPSIFAISTALVLITALVAGYFPARMAAKKLIHDSVRFE